MGNSASIPSTSQSRRTGGLGARRRTVRPPSWAHRWAVIKAPTPQAAMNWTPEASTTRSEDPVVRASNRPQRSSGAVSRSTSPTNQRTVGAPVDRGVPGPDPSTDTTRGARSTVGERAPIDGLAVEPRDLPAGGPAGLSTPSLTTEPGSTSHCASIHKLEHPGQWSYLANLSERVLQFGVPTGYAIRVQRRHRPDCGPPGPTGTSAPVATFDQRTRPDQEITDVTTLIESRT